MDLERLKEQRERLRELRLQRATRICDARGPRALTDEELELIVRDTLGRHGYEIPNTEHGLSEAVSQALRDDRESRNL